MVPIELKQRLAPAIEREFLRILAERWKSQRLHDHQQSTQGGTVMTGEAFDGCMVPCLAEAASPMIPFGVPALGQPPERDHLPEIRAGLRAGIDALARHLLGEPVRGSRRAKTLNFGTRSGSLHVEVSGPKQGLWYDHAENVGGDALDLIQRINGGTFSDTVAWAANWLGIDIGRPAPKPDPARQAELERERERSRAQRAAEQAQDEARRVYTAQWLWSLRKPLTGTQGARYLASRGITEPAEGWPDCVAFLPTADVTFDDRNADGRDVRRTVPCAGALIVAATNSNGLVHGVQRIYVDHDGKNIRDTSGKKVKITNGVLSGNGAVVRLPRRVR